MKLNDRKNITPNENDNKNKFKLSPTFKELLKKITKSFLLLAILFGVFMIYYNRKPSQRVEDNVIKRDLTLEYLIFDTPPEEKNTAWIGELPSIIQKDMKYAEEHDCSISYSFKTNRLDIKKNKDGTWLLDIFSPYDLYANISEYVDFSIYKSEENLVIYGYTELFGGSGWFSKCTISEYDLSQKTLTYNANLPFSLKEASINSTEVGEYTLITEDDSKFTFYKNGMKIVEQEFPYGKIEQSDLYRGHIINDKKELYVAYAKLKDNKPYLDFVYVDIADSFKNFSDYLETNEIEKTNEAYFVKTFEKDGKEYALIPASWETYGIYTLGYTDFKTTITNPDFSLYLLPLEENLVSVEFLYIDSFLWRTIFTYNLNGTICTRDNSFNGYDNSVRLPKHIANKFTKTVTTLEEYWQNVEDIREAYFDYYDHAGD